MKNDISKFTDAQSGSGGAQEPSLASVTLSRLAVSSIQVPSSRGLLYHAYTFVDPLSFHPISFPSQPSF